MTGESEMNRRYARGPDDINPMPTTRSSAPSLDRRPHGLRARPRRSRATGTLSGVSFRFFVYRAFEIRQRRDGVLAARCGASVSGRER